MPPFLLPLLTWAALLLRYPRRTLAVAVPLFVCIAALGLWLQWQENTSQQALDQLDIRLHYATNQCPPDRPLQASILNTSDKMLHELSWRIAAYRPGEHTNLAEERYNSPFFNHAEPLTPGQQWQECLPLPELRSGYRPASLDFRAEKRRGRLQ